MRTALDDGFGPARGFVQGEDDAARREPRRATVSIAGARASYLGPALALTPHRNAAATVVIALERPFVLRLFPRGREGDATEASIAVVPAGMRHHLLAQGAMAFVYLDGLGDDARRLASADLAGAQARIAREDPTVLHGWSAHDWCEALGLLPRLPPDPRIAPVVRAIGERPQSFPRLADAARLAGLSPTRFHALFRQALGVPFRRYRLWRRMVVALRAVSAGETLTGAALDAGFSSSAHFSAAFRAMFGLAPSALTALAPRIRFEESPPEPRAGTPRPRGA